MGQLAILMDNNGRQIANPIVVDASVSWAARDGVAQAFDGSGARIAELHGARVEWIEAGGIRLSGMEPTNPGATAFRAQAWQFKPSVEMKTTMTFEDFWNDETGPKHFAGKPTSKDLARSAWDRATELAYQQRSPCDSCSDQLTTTSLVQGEAAEFGQGL